MKYCVLGAGLMGKAIAYDLLQQKDTTQVIIVDKDETKLKETIKFLNAACRDVTCNVSTRTIDVAKLNIIFAEQMDFVLQQVLAKDPFKLKKVAMKKKKRSKKATKK
jgi:saccharopine dehydrogenase-like NADP-dependent oxidoreductase